MPKITSMFSERIGRGSRPITYEEAKKIFEDYYRRVDAAAGRRSTVLSYEWREREGPYEEKQ